MRDLSVAGIDGSAHTRSSIVALWVVYGEFSLFHGFGKVLSDVYGRDSIRASYYGPAGGGEGEDSNRHQCSRMLFGSISCSLKFAGKPGTYIGYGLTTAGCPDHSAPGHVLRAAVQELEVVLRDAAPGLVVRTYLPHSKRLSHHHLPAPNSIRSYHYS